MLQWGMDSNARDRFSMEGFVSRCPNTGRNVQGWSAEEMLDDPDMYETITCAECGQLHWINRASGRVLGDTQDKT